MESPPPRLYIKHSWSIIIIVITRGEAKWLSTAEISKFPFGYFSDCVFYGAKSNLNVMTNQSAIKALNNASLRKLRDSCSCLRSILKGTEDCALLLACNAFYLYASKALLNLHLHLSISLVPPKILIYPFFFRSEIKWHQECSYVLGNTDSSDFSLILKFKNDSQGLD